MGKHLASRGFLIQRRQETRAHYCPQRQLNRRKMGDQES